MKYKYVWDILNFNTDIILVEEVVKNYLSSSFVGKVAQQITIAVAHATGTQDIQVLNKIVRDLTKSMQATSVRFDIDNSDFRKPIMHFGRIRPTAEVIGTHEKTSTFILEAGCGSPPLLPAGSPKSSQENIDLERTITIMVYPSTAVAEKAKQDDGYYNSEGKMDTQTIARLLSIYQVAA